jgi:hypothetical protein
MKAMKPMSALLRLVSLFALLGMLIAPVSTVAAEYAMADMSATVSAQMEEMTGMAGDMDCCPDAQPAKPDCGKSCPFVVICSTSAPLALLKAAWTSVALTWTPFRFADQRFERLSSLAAEPPARPPKA